MRFSNLALFALSPYFLSAFASPVAQYSASGEETTTTDLQWFSTPTVTPIELPSTTDTGFLTIQTSMPSDMPETTDTGYMTIQTSTPEASSTTSADESYPSDVDEGGEDDGGEWCDDDEEDDDDETCDEDVDQGEESSTAVPTSTTFATETSTSTEPAYPTSTIPPQVDLAPGIYQIYPVRALISMCLQIADGKEAADGTPVVIAPCDGSPEQDWEVTPAQWYPPAGNIYIKLAGTNFCLDASFPLGDDTPMKIWTCYDGLVQQRWNYNLAAQLYLVDQGQCLDLTDGNIDNGTVVQTWTCDPPNGNQHWFVIAKPQ